MKVTRTDVCISLRRWVGMSMTECVTSGTVAGPESKGGGLKIAQLFQSVQVPVSAGPHGQGVRREECLRGDTCDRVCAVPSTEAEGSPESRPRY